MKGLEASRTTSTHHVSARATQRPHFRYRNQGMKTVQDHPCVREPGGSRAHLKYIAVSTIILAALLPGTAVHQLHAQNEVPTITIGDAEPVQEGATAEFTVTLSFAPTQTVTVTYTTVGGTAMEGSDYRNASGTLNFAIGQQIQGIEVETLEDRENEVEGPETFMVQLSMPSGATVEDGTGTGRITNVPPIFSWGGKVEVSTSTLTIGEGETLSYSVRVSDDPAKKGWWLFVQVDGVVYHDGEYTTPKTCRDEMRNPILDEMGNPTTCEIPLIRWVPSVGWELDPRSSPTRWRTVSLTALEDKDTEDEFLTFTHEMWDEHTNCPEYLHAIAPVRVHIVDNDRPGGGTPELAIADVEVTEGLLATFSVTLSATSEVPVTFSYETMDGTARAGSDYTSKSGPLTIPAGERIGLVEVQTTHDNVREETESFTVRLSEVSGATLTDGMATGTILDDDVDPPPLAIADAEVTEGGMATFVVTLGPGATGQVTVDYQTEGRDGDRRRLRLQGKTGTLTFVLPANGQSKSTSIRSRTPMRRMPRPSPSC